MKSTGWELKYAALALVATLAACGGGSDVAPAPAPAPAPAGITLGGTASTGAVVSGKTVNAKCAIGTGAGTTKDDGSYSVAIEGGKWPCLAHVTTADGTDLYTVAAPASSTATTATANITPVTQLVVASLSGTAPATYYGAFDATAAAAVTSTAVLAAQTAVVATLTSGGVANVPADPVSTPMTPTYTAALTDLGTVLTTSGTTLAALTTTVASTSTTNVTGLPPVTSGTPSLPADVALRPAASNCAALRSGTYRIIHPKVNTALTDQYNKFTVNVASPVSITFSDGSTGTWTANGPCHYTGDSGRSDIVVSPSGVIVARYLDDDNVTYRMAMGLPDQAHTLAEVAGAWNSLNLNGHQGLFAGLRVSATIDATGVVNATICGDPTSVNWNTTTCRTLPAGTLALRANADGGFDMMDGGTLGGRVFAYRAGGGELMLVEVDNDGSLGIMTHQRTNGLPTVGTLSTSWGLPMGSQLTAFGTLSESQSTVVSVDTTAGSYVRKTHNPGTTNDHLETLLTNNPVGGYTYRAHGTAPADDGTIATIRDFTALALRGMGMSVLLLESQQIYLLSVAKP